MPTILKICIKKANKTSAQDVNLGLNKIKNTKITKLNINFKIKNARIQWFDSYYR
jgi:hypothetical protein